MDSESDPTGIPATGMMDTHRPPPLETPRPNPHEDFLTNYIKTSEKRIERMERNMEFLVDAISELKYTESSKRTSRRSRSPPSDEEYEQVNEEADEELFLASQYAATPTASILKPKSKGKLGKRRTSLAHRLSNVAEDEELPSSDSDTSESDHPTRKDFFGKSPT